MHARKGASNCVSGGGGDCNGDGDGVLQVGVALAALAMQLTFGMWSSGVASSVGLGRRPGSSFSLLIRYQHPTTVPHLGAVPK
jgi:hypothetical protein